MRRLWIGGLVALTACAGGGDTDADDLPATLAVTYSWSGFDNMVEDNCAGAWADTIYVEMEHPEGDYNLRQQGCDNSVIEIPELRTGDWIVLVRTTQFEDTAPASYGTTDVLDVTLGSDEYVEIEAVIECVENGFSCDRAE